MDKDSHSIKFDPRYYQLVSTTNLLGYGCSSKLLVFDALGLLTNNEKRITYGKIYADQVYPPENQAIESLRVCINVLQVKSTNAYGAMEKYIGPQNRNLMNPIRNAKSDGTIFETHIVKNGNGQHLYKTSFQTIPFKDCYVALERSICIDNMSINDTKIPCEWFSKSDSQTCRMFSKNSLNGTGQPDNFQSSHMLMPQVVNERFGDVDAVRAYASDSETTDFSPEKRSGVRFVIKNNKQTNKRGRKPRSDRSRSVLKECNNAKRNNAISKPLRKKMRTKPRKLFKPLKTVYKTISLSEDSDLDSDADKENRGNVTHQPISKATRTNSETPTRNNISGSNKNLDATRETNWRQLTLSKVSGKLMGFEKIAKVSLQEVKIEMIEPKFPASELKDFNIDLTRPLKVEINNPFTTYDMEDSNAQLERALVIEQSLFPMDMDMVSPSSPKILKPTLPRMKQQLGRHFSIYKRKHLESVDDSSNYKICWDNIRKRLVASGNQSNSRIRIIKNTKPESVLRSPGWLLTDELIGINSLEVPKPLNDPSTNHGDLLTELPEILELPHLTDTTDSAPEGKLLSTSLQNLNQADHQDEPFSLDTILEDVLSMEEEQKGLSGQVMEVEEIGGEFNCSQWLSLDSLDMTLAPLLSEEEFECTLSDLKEDFC